jgi:hypothetical protein
MHSGGLDKAQQVKAKEFNNMWRECKSHGVQQTVAEIYFFLLSSTKW